MPEEIQPHDAKVASHFKAVRPDGTAFYNSSFRWLTERGNLPKRLVRHPRPNLSGNTSSYLSVATVPTDCTGFSWPCRLLAVEPVGATASDPTYPHKVRCETVRVVAELPAWQVFGPNGEAVVAVIERARTLTADELDRLAAAWDAAWYAAWDAAWYAARAATWDAARAAARAAARDAAWYTARAATWDAAWDAAWAAALAELTRDLITLEQYDLLIGPWKSVVGS